MAGIVLGTFALLSHTHKTDSGYVLIILNSFTNEKTQREVTCSMMNRKGGAELGHEIFPLTPSFEAGDMCGV